MPVRTGIPLLARPLIAGASGATGTAMASGIAMASGLGRFAVFVVAVVAAVAMVAAGAARASAAEPLRYLALGDSYTIGEGVEPAARWPVGLARALRLRGFAVGEPEIIARTGWTVGELSEALAEARPQGPFALISVLAGVNDQYRGEDPERFRPRLAALLRRAVELAGGRPGRVLVLSIPDWSVTPFARESGRDPAEIARQLDRFNEIVRAEAGRLGCRYVDVTPQSRQALADRRLLAADGLHPSAAIYAQWVQLALPEAAAALASR